LTVPLRSNSFTVLSYVGGQAAYVLAMRTLERKSNAALEMAKALAPPQI
jgi:hypothetical protein